MPFFTEGRMKKKLERKKMENVSDRHYTFKGASGRKISNVKNCRQCLLVLFVKVGLRGIKSLGSDDDKLKGNGLF
jgi:hypothetical protein